LMADRDDAPPPPDELASPTGSASDSSGDGMIMRATPEPTYPRPLRRIMTPVPALKIATALETQEARERRNEQREREERIKQQQQQQLKQQQQQQQQLQQHQYLLQQQQQQKQQQQQPSLQHKASDNEIRERIRKQHDELRRQQQLLHREELRTQEVRAHRQGSQAAPGMSVDGWVKYVDAESGYPYFYNAHSGETRWDPPPASANNATAVSQPQPSAPAAATPAYEVAPLVAVAARLQTWDKLVDPTTGQPYFHNRATGETTWTPPEGYQVDDPHPAAAPSGQNVAQPAAPQAPVAETAASGWAELFDGAHGLPYWYNGTTGESVWEKPPGVDQPQQQAGQQTTVPASFPFQATGADDDDESSTSDYGVAAYVI